MKTLRVQVQNYQLKYIHSAEPISLFHIKIKGVTSFIIIVSSDTLLFSQFPNYEINLWQRQGTVYNLLKSIT